MLCQIRFYVTRKHNFEILIVKDCWFFLYYANRSVKGTQEALVWFLYSLRWVTFLSYSFQLFGGGGATWLYIIVSKLLMASAVHSFIV